MEKLKLELELEVTSFEAMTLNTVEARMATQACSYNDACPTRLCTDRC